MDVHPPKNGMYRYWSIAMYCFSPFFFVFHSAPPAPPPSCLANHSVLDEARRSFGTWPSGSCWRHNLGSWHHHWKPGLVKANRGLNPGWKTYQWLMNNYNIIYTILYTLYVYIYMGCSISSDWSTCWMYSSKSANCFFPDVGVEEVLYRWLHMITNISVTGLS